MTGLQANAEEEAESSIQKGSQTSGTNRSTIGNTTISTAEAMMIRKEVRSAIQQAFPGINFSAGQPTAEIVDLTGSATHSAPLAIAGSDVSVASTRSNNGAGESKTSFSQLVSGAGTVAPAQTFATAQWRPKEPPYYYGRSNGMSTCGLLSCVTISPSWVVVMHSRSHTL